jgi:hypothetical protein
MRNELVAVPPRAHLIASEDSEIQRAPRDRLAKRDFAKEQ